MACWDSAEVGGATLEAVDLRHAFVCIPLVFVEEYDGDTAMSISHGRLEPGHQLGGSGISD